MLCFVDIEHEKVLQDPEERSIHLVRRLDAKLKLEEISGEACLLQRYTRVTRQRLREWGIRALLISGNGTHWAEYDDEAWSEMLRIIQAAELPILGFCGGCQLIAMAHDAPLGPMRRLKDGENDLDTERQPCHFKERGYMPVHVLQPDPLFEDLGARPVFFQAHYWEIKEIPPGFKNLASTDECCIQAIKHQERLVYGTQFHPEAHDAEHNDGRRLIANFLRVAGVID